MKSVSDQTKKRLIVEYDAEKNAAMSAEEAAAGRALLYDVNKDYFGLLPLDDPGETERLKKALIEAYSRTIPHRVGAGDSKVPGVDADTVKQLKSLGYF